MMYYTFIYSISMGGARNLKLGGNFGKQGQGHRGQ